MDTVVRYRGRDYAEEDITEIRDFVARHPGKSRCALSRALCEEWNWRQANGALREMVCRGLMLALHRAGHLDLPPAKKVVNPFLTRRRRAAVIVDETPIETPLSALPPLTFRQVRRTPEEPLFDGLIEEHHYLGYTQPVGEHLKYLVFAGDRPVACFAWSSAPRHLGPRDRFIGWSAEARRRNIRFLAYNPRYLVLPWVRVPHLASHLLGRMARRISADFETVYAHPIHYLESFIHPGRFKGTCYRAANWRFLGLTTGRGKADQTGKPNRPLKEVLGYPLRKDFREVLGAVR
jgi:hypothetical protein